MLGLRIIAREVALLQRGLRDSDWDRGHMLRELGTVIRETGVGILQQHPVPALRALKVLTEVVGDLVELEPVQEHHRHYSAVLSRGREVSRQGRTHGGPRPPDTGPHHSDVPGHAK